MIDLTPVKQAIFDRFESEIYDLDKEIAAEELLVHSAEAMVKEIEALREVAWRAFIVVACATGETAGQHSRASLYESLVSAGVVSD